MFCKNCGGNIPDGTVQCPYCWQNLSNPYQAQTEIKTYLTESILVTLFCCLPFGIISIVNAAKVSDLVSAGRYEEAIRASNNAKTWALVGLITGIVISGLYVFLSVIGALVE